MICVHPFVEKHHELVFCFFWVCFFNGDECSYVKSYSSTSVVLINISFLGGYLH
jgi:hypothetical protein